MQMAQSCNAPCGPIPDFNVSEVQDINLYADLNANSIVCLMLGIFASCLVL